VEGIKDNKKILYHFAIINEFINY